jgi:hypothetical protein
MLTFPCPEVAGHLNNHFPTVFALGRGLSCDVQLRPQQQLETRPSAKQLKQTDLFALHSQMIRQDLTATLGTHLTCSNAAAAEVAIAALHSQKVAFVHQYFAAVGFVFAGPLVQP